MYYYKLPVLIIALLASLVSSQLALAEDAPVCNKLVGKKIDLTGDGWSETIWVSVYGKTCREAKYNISIESSSGKLIYNFSHPFSDMYVSHDNSEAEVRANIELFVTNFFDYSIRPRMPSLERMPHRDEVDGIADVRFVSESEYRRLQSYNLPYISHSSWYEGAMFVTYDPDKQKFIVFGGF